MMKVVVKLYTKGEKDKEHLIPSVFKGSILLEMGIVIKESNFENLKFPKQVRHSLFFRSCIFPHAQRSICAG